ncbi:hypothetical protein [Sphingobacterium paucimobilis]|uniref:Uncharacterized protein n=1 Tax=Sphingobacterium paucimobilis HER1398 TaxID=1346330 RepID=U2J5E2_9SPHI|nr:hypothetical protein [Sphingobacterium paucimobilis]ERJ60144.1 hypothetical protein M472_15380 [Sphingobacterium paucimobilis HER1398]
MKRYIFTLLVFILVNGLVSNAQKLPQTQQNSIWLENFEADGKLDEWQQPLQAYNDDTYIAYSLANDDQYLYLAVKSNRWSKILQTSMVFEVIDLDGKPVSVTFPKKIEVSPPRFDLEKIMTKNTEIKSNVDGIQNIQEVGIMGIDEIKEEAIPLLNEYGIEVGVMELLEESDVYPSGELYYLIEMAIPLLYFKIKDINQVEQLDYRIILNGKVPTDIQRATLSQPRKASGGISQKLANAIYEKEVDMFTKTDLNGTYRLATKPD